MITHCASITLYCVASIIITNLMVIYMINNHTYIEPISSSDTFHHGGGYINTALTVWITTHHACLELLQLYTHPQHLPHSLTHSLSPSISFTTYAFSYSSFSTTNTATLPPLVSQPPLPSFPFLFPLHSLFLSIYSCSQRLPRRASQNYQTEENQLLTM